MKKITLCVQRVLRLNAVPNYRLYVYNKQGNVVACVGCSGKHDYAYFLYDESQEERVHTFITRWDKQRNKTYACEVYYGLNPEEIWPLAS